METQPCFNLNAALESWRNELAAQPQLSADDRRELEKHLADSMAELRQRGLTEEEAFWLARRRIGAPQQLAEEFQKSDPNKIWRERVFWMAAGSLALLSLYQICGTIETIGRWIIHPEWNRFLDDDSFWLIPLKIFIIGAFFASKWLGKFSRAIQWFIEKRLRLIVLYFCLVAFSSLQSVATQIEAMKWIYVWHDFITKIIFSSGFLLLLIWLLPARNQKRPRSKLA